MVKDVLLKSNTDLFVLVGKGAKKCENELVQNTGQNYNKELQC
jgi:hypothetical protein